MQSTLWQIAKPVKRISNCVAEVSEVCRARMKNGGFSAVKCWPPKDTVFCGSYPGAPDCLTKKLRVVGTTVGENPTAVFYERLA